MLESQTGLLFGEESSGRARGSFMRVHWFAACGLSILLTSSGVRAQTLPPAGSPSQTSQPNAPSSAQAVSSACPPTIAPAASPGGTQSPTSAAPSSPTSSPAATPPTNPSPTGASPGAPAPATSVSVSVSGSTPTGAGPPPATVTTGNGQAAKPTKADVLTLDLPRGRNNASDIAGALTGIPGIIGVTAITNTRLVFVLDKSPTSAGTPVPNPPLETQIQTWVNSLAATKPYLSITVDAVDLPAGTGNAPDIATKLANIIPGVTNIVPVGNTRLLFLLDETPDPKFPNKPRDIVGLRRQIAAVVNSLALPYPIVHVVQFPLGEGRTCDIATALAKQFPGVLNIAPIGNTRLAFSIDSTLRPLEVRELESLIDESVSALAEPLTPPSPNTETYAVRLYYDHDPATAATVISGSYPEVKASAIAPDTIFLSETIPAIAGRQSSNKRDPLQDARRALSRIDQPRPQVSLEAWSLQFSTTRKQDMEDAGPVIEKIANRYNIIISDSVTQGWKYLVERLSDDSYLDRSFSNYLTKKTFVRDGAPCCSRAEPRDYDNAQPESGYGLGYGTLFRPLAPNLVNMLVALAASARPKVNADALINVMETGQAEVPPQLGAPTLSCQEHDELGYRHYRHLQLECVRTVLDEHLFVPVLVNSSTSALGEFRAAIANFLFQYKIMTEYPNDFEAFSASESAANLDAQLSPVVDAFMSDLTVFQWEIKNEIELNELFSRRQVSYAASGIVSVNVVAGNAASVQTTTQNYFDATPPTTLGDFAAAVKSIGTPSGGTQSSGSQLNLPPLLTSNISATEAVAALSAVQALTRTPVSAKIGKGLTLSATVYSLSGASGTEMDISVESNENGAELVTAATASNLSSTVAQSDDLASRVSDHKVSTRVRVNSLNLFKLSTMESVLARGKTPWKPIDPWLEIPVLGEVVKVPRRPAITYHRSFIFINALVVPTAADLGNGIPINADEVMAPGNPGLFISAHKFDQLGGLEVARRIKKFHQSLLGLFASQHVGADGSVIPQNAPVF
jgi:hypothetical protein